jgi:phage repressor protein C with HTH and peptisase S24 domain
MDIQNQRRANLREWVTLNGTPAKEKSYFSQLLSGSASFGERSARRLEIDYKMTVGALDAVKSGFGYSGMTDTEKLSAVEEMQELEDGPSKGAPVKRRRIADFDLVSADDTDGEVGEIEYWDVRGSCGGGFLNEDRIPKGHLVKEASFFHKYNVRPEDLFSIYADGDSMADFIVDGDIVIFDKRHKEPRSGKIYAIDHPDGLKIKLLRRGIDGSWTLESKNIDKRMYPDERIELGQQDLLKVHGEFIYRQGG